MKKVMCHDCLCDELTVLSEDTCYGCGHNENSTQVEDDGECMMGTAYGGGCTVIECPECGAQLNRIPHREERCGDES